MKRPDYFTVQVVLPERTELLRFSTAVSAEELGRAVLAAAAGRKPAGPRLGPRELAVLDAAGRGEPSKAIAAALGISERTVKFHLASAMRKLGARSRTEAVMLALRAGLLAL